MRKAIVFLLGFTVIVGTGPAVGSAFAESDRAVAPVVTSSVPTAPCLTLLELNAVGQALARKANASADPVAAYRAQRFTAALAPYSCVRGVTVALVQRDGTWMVRLDAPLEISEGAGGWDFPGGWGASVGHECCGGGNFTVESAYGADGSRYQSLQNWALSGFQRGQIDWRKAAADLASGIPSEMALTAAVAAQWAGLITDFQFQMIAKGAVVTQFIGRVVDWALSHASGGGGGATDPGSSYDAKGDK